MGFYSRHVLPHVIDLAMKNKEAARLRAQVIPHACGDVLEIGIGSGLNLPLYSSAVNRVYGVDRSLELQRIARKRASSLPVKIDFILQSAEDSLPIADKSIDTIVITWTLCSIANPTKALRQMKRVLRQNGHLIFVEHGRAPDRNVAAWQDRLTPAWKCIGGGCHLNRKIDELIGEAGFQITELETSYLAGPRPMTYTYNGVAEVA